MARHSDDPVKVGTEGMPLFREAVGNEWAYHPDSALKFVVPLARTTDPETSHEAAASMRSAAHSQRLAILEYLATCGPHGATADETDLALGWRSGRAGRRYGELEGRAATPEAPARPALVLVAAGRRKTSTGRDAQVYVLPQYG